MRAKIVLTYRDATVFVDYEDEKQMIEVTSFSIKNFSNSEIKAVISYHVGTTLDTFIKGIK